jgi:hypothetical protein
MQNQRSIRTLIAALAAGVVVLSFVALASAQSSAPQRLTAFAALVGHVPGDRSVTVDITIDRWSTDDERQTLLKTFHRGGTQALQDALEGTDTVGTLRTPDGASWDLHYAAQVRLGDDGRRIFLATDVPVQLWEVHDNTGSTESPFSFLEIRMDEDGGQGRLARGSDVELSADGKHLQLDDYGSQPVPLQQVRRVE